MKHFTKKAFVKYFQIDAWDVLTGIPAGFLIFMGTVLVYTIIGVNQSLTKLMSIEILSSISLMVGILAGITRLQHGPATGLSASLVASGILGYLWISARPGDQINNLVIGPIGIILTIITCPIGGWLGANIRKKI